MASVTSLTPSRGRDTRTAVGLGGAAQGEGAAKLTGPAVEKQAVAWAQQLAGMVRDYDAAGIAEWLYEREVGELYATAVALAAMVDVSRPPSQLLAWLTPPELPPRMPRKPAVRQPCGSRAAYQRGCRCVPCVVAARAYYRQAKRRERAA